MNKFLVFVCFLPIFFHASAQSVQYEVSLEPLEFTELGGIQSYAFGSNEGEWLIIGGRLDGLHQRQPFASFDSAGNNDNIIVVNPETGKVWKQSIGHLAPNIKEQLSSTNMQFYQEGEFLLLTGGYAFSPSSNDHVTFPYLTVVDIPTLIEKVKNSSVQNEDFRQVENDIFAVTGGRLDKIDDTFFLVGGHKFMGRYNPMGPDHGPGFSQEYTQAIRKFKLDFEANLEVQNTPELVDKNHLHRRDYNLVPQIIKDKRILMLYSGVFQKAQNLPWLYPVAIDRDSFEAITSFQQKFNHYHCATLPIFHPAESEMHTLFFGGIAQFYKEDDLLIQDNDVPFVNTIADVAILADGTMKENINETKLPGYLGAGSEFIFSNTASFFDDGILNGDSLVDGQAIGYIFGGIRSSQANIFFINTGNESEAANVIYKVTLKKLVTTMNIEIDTLSPPKLEIYPNPAQSFIRVILHIAQPEDLNINIYNLAGQKIHQSQFSKSELNAGKNYLVLDKVKVDFGAYLYEFKIGQKIFTRKVIWSN